MGKYCYNCLPILVRISSEHFQQKMNNLFKGFLFIRAYIYDILFLTKGYWSDHVKILELTLNTYIKRNCN